MAKKKSDAVWGVEQADELMDAIFAEAKKQFGADNFYTGSESEQLIVGLPLPSLSLRYLFQSTVFPLSRMTMVTGQQGSCKSAFLYEIFRWHRMFGGRNVLLECETKDSPELRASILEYDPKAVGVKPCNSLEEWQAALTKFITLNQDMMTGTKTNPGPGRIIPFCIGIDSLMAKASEENIEKVMKEGFAGRGHPVEALKISQFMKVWPQKLFGWPFSVVGTNHLKPSTDHMGRPTRNIPGGMSLKFQETYEIEMAFLEDIKRADHEGVVVQMLARKNSLGPSRKKIKASLVWWNEYVDPSNSEVAAMIALAGERPPDQPFVIQRTMWNWHTSSIELLLEIQSKDPGRWRKIEPYLDLHPERSKGNMVWSTALGIAPTEKVTFREAGEILETRPDILSHIHGLLGIRERYVFEPGKDFKSQLDKAKALEAKKPGIAEEMAEQLEPDPLED